jgi:uncharacterized damage-inducible protein DinB
MDRGTLDLARHNAWATAQVLETLRGLDEMALNATVPGTYGTILETIRHLVDAEGSYVYRLTGAWPDHPWRGDADVGLDVLNERAAILGETLERFLAEPWDCDRLGEARGGDGSVFAVPAGVFLTQIFHHANEHRAHICTMLGSLGHDAPDVSAWGYSLAAERSWVKHVEER